MATKRSGSKRSGSTRSTSTKARSGSGSGSGAGRKGGAGGKRKSSNKRELIDTGTDKRYVRRDARGRIKESDDVGRSLASDRRTKAKTVSKPGQGDKGDRKRS